MKIPLGIAIGIVSTTAVVADGISREQAIHIAARYMQRHHENVRHLQVHAWPRWGDFDGEYSPEIRLRLSHRKYWFVLFTPRDLDVYGGAHKIYIAMDTGEVLGWGGER